MKPFHSLHADDIRLKTKQQPMNSIYLLLVRAMAVQTTRAITGLVCYQQCSKNSLDYLLYILRFSYNDDYRLTYLGVLSLSSIMCIYDAQSQDNDQKTQFIDINSLRMAGFMCLQYFRMEMCITARECRRSGHLNNHRVATTHIERIKTASNENIFKYTQSQDEVWMVCYVQKCISAQKLWKNSFNNAYFPSFFILHT